MHILQINNRITEFMVFKMKDGAQLKAASATSVVALMIIPLNALKTAILPNDLQYLFSVVQNVMHSDENNSKKTNRLFLHSQRNC